MIGIERTNEAWHPHALLAGERTPANPAGLVVAKRVEEVFERNGLIRELRIAGRTIRSTGEHPFYRRGDGWVPLGAIRVGDRLLGEDGHWRSLTRCVSPGIGNPP